MTSSSPRLKISSDHPESDIIDFPEDGLNTLISYNKYSLLPGESFCPGHLSYKYICDTWGPELYHDTQDINKKTEQNTTTDSNQKVSKQGKRGCLNMKPSMTSSLPKDKVMEEEQAIKITYDDVKRLNLNFPEYELNSTIISYNKDSLLPGESFCSGHLSYKYICDSLESELYPNPHNTSQKTQQNTTSHEPPEKVSKSRKRKSSTSNSRDNKKTPRKTIEDSQIGPDICDINLQDTSVTSKESYSEDQIFKKPIGIPRSKLKVRKNRHATQEKNLKNCGTNQIELLDTKNQTPPIRLNTICLNDENLLHSGESSTCGYNNESASELYPNTLDTTQKSQQNETAENSEQSDTTQTSDRNKTKHDSSQKVFKQRKRKSLNLKPKYNKKTKKSSTPRIKIEDELSLNSNDTSPNSQSPIIDKEELDSPSTPPRPSMSRRRTLYSPKVFESSGDITRIFSTYVEI